jgi:hypothetical protein
MDWIGNKQGYERLSNETECKAENDRNSKTNKGRNNQMHYKANKKLQRSRYQIKRKQPLFSEQLRENKSVLFLEFQSSSNVLKYPF